MSLATKPPVPQANASQPLWKSPASKAKWVWLIASIVLYTIIFIWFFPLNRANPSVAPRSNGSLFFFGLVAFLMILAVASFSLRSRFVRALPGKAQDWLWMHTWLAIAAVFVAMIHSNYAHITSNQLSISDALNCASDSYCGGVSLYALILLVLSGIAGRLLDVWQSRAIAQDASANGVGIVRALKERILEMELVVERLCAGKSEVFKQYCLQAIEGGSVLPAAFPALVPAEQPDFQRAYGTLTGRSRLLHSLQRQLRARQMMRVWRYVHMALACLALLIVLYHVTMEVLSHGLHLIPVQ